LPARCPQLREKQSQCSLEVIATERVRLLLEAASAVMADCSILDGDISLDVTVIAPAGRQMPDATNLLGGIGDVLQARATGADVEHLGPLAQVACFHDDAQIREVHYRCVDGAEVGYEVVIGPTDRLTE
jgi:hypothetical protein